MKVVGTSMQGKTRQAIQVALNYCNPAGVFLRFRHAWVKKPSLNPGERAQLSYEAHS